jgi:DivIVA domain-containing protein
MDVTPQLLHDVEFREAKRGGYNTQDVDEFLERLAVGLERQEASVKEVRQRLEVAEARAAEAERRALQAEQAASDTSATDETLKRTLVLAQRTADAAIREAEEQAARTLSSAQEQASQLLAEAQDVAERARAEAEDEVRRAHEEARTRVLGEMRDLEVARDRLRSDVGLLERYLDEQRERVRRTLHELQRMLDDPESLREVELPVVSEVHAPVDPPAAYVDPMAEPEHPAAWEPDDEAWGAADEPMEEEYAADDLVEDPGPPTQPVDVLAEREADDDAYLAELRKAMTDDSPLGPRDDAGDAGLFDTGADAGRSRFGRRR